MKCKFCGAELKDGTAFCENCGNRSNALGHSTESKETSASELIDSMPELHNELDRIGEIRERAKHRKRRVIVSVLILLVCAVGVWFGMDYVTDWKQTAQPVDGEMTSESVTSAVSGEVNETLLGNHFTSVKILDGATAEDAFDSVKTELGITNEDIGFVMKNKISVGNDTYYRFSQTFGGLRVYGGEVILQASQNGTALALNSRIIEADGLDLNAKLEAGSASNAISEYVNKLSGDYRVTGGINVTAAERVVCNFEGKTYLAYCSNVSGYNEKGEYVAYDAFVDANAGSGIYICSTAGYENDEAASEPETDSGTSAAAAFAADSSLRQTAEESAMSMFIVNDKFNWNDKTKTGALEEINQTDIADGTVSAYVSETKSAVDKVYAYFAEQFGYRGLDGKNGAFKVYLNSNEYLKDKLPPEMALYSDDVLMFIREDLTEGKLNFNVAAHEYAHGVMHFIAQFDGTGALSENAAIAEGLADVFGELCEAHFADGSADWVHGSRDLAAPGNGFLTKLSEKAEIKDFAECYRYSTIVSHAAYQMSANGVDADELGELMFRSLCLMTRNTDFSQWRSVTEFTARSMADAGRLTEEQFAAVTAALDNTEIKGQRLYAWRVDEIGNEEAVEEAVEEDTEQSAGENAVSDGIGDKVIE